MSFSGLLEWKFNNETFDTIDTRETENWYEEKYRIYTVSRDEHILVSKNFAK